MSMRKRADDTELLQYKIEMMEKRLDYIEKIMYSSGAKFGGEGGVNGELMQLVMTLIKQQVSAPTTQPPTTSAPAEVARTTENVSHTQSVCDAKTSDDSGMASFNMGRRRFVT